MDLQLKDSYGTHVQVNDFVIAEMDLWGEPGLGDGLRVRPNGNHDGCRGYLFYGQIRFMPETFSFVLADAVYVGGYYATKIRNPFGSIPLSTLSKITLRIAS